MTVATSEWLIATVIVTLCAIAAVIGAARGRSELSLPSLIPVAAGVCIRTTDTKITLPAHGWIVALSIATVSLAVVSGGPLVTWTVRLTDRTSSPHTNASAANILRPQ